LPEWSPPDSGGPRHVNMCSVISANGGEETALKSNRYLNETELSPTFHNYQSDVQLIV